MTMPMDTKAPVVVHLPGKYLLTEAGVRYFVRRQIPLHELRTRRGSQASGIVWRRYDPEHVKQLVAYELLSEIEVERTEFLSRRSDIMALTSLTVEGILEKRFRPELKEMIRHSEVFAPIKSKVAAAQPEQIQSYLKKHEPAIENFRRTLAVEPIEQIRGDSELHGEERDERIRQIMRIIASIDSETWFLLSVIPGTSGRRSLINAIQSLILVYTRRFRIADYVSLMLMELLQYAERTQILNFAERDQYVRTHPGALAERLADANFREKLFQRAAASKSLLGLNYHFAGNPYSPSRRPAFEITVINKGLVGYKSRNEIITKRNRNVRNVPLARFYETENPQQLDTTLGVHYLSYVEQACRDVGMTFSAEMARDERSEETRTRLRLAL
jgi:hypothetical protein